MNRITFLPLLAAAATISQAQFWHFSNAYAPTGASADGSVVCGTDASGFFFWTAGGGPVSVGGNNYAGWPQISDDGTKINGNMTSTFGHPEMARYNITTSTWEPFGSLGFYSTGTGTPAASSWGISGDGSRVVGQAYYNTTGVTGTRVNPIVSDGTTVTNLFPNTSGNGRVTCANGDGSMVGGYKSSSSTGSIWINGTETLLSGLFNGNTISFGAPSDISYNGRWLTGNGTSATTFRPYVLDRDTNMFTVLENPFTVGDRAVATSISNDGQTIVGRYLRVGGNLYTEGKGFIWTPQTGVILLNEYVDSLGIDRAGLSLNNPFGMSGDGRTIVGIGTPVVPPTEAFVLRLPEVRYATAITLLEGEEGSGGLNELLRSDNSYYCAFNDPASLACRVQFDSSTTVTGASELRFDIESNVARGGLAFGVSFYDFANSNLTSQYGAVASTTDSSAAIVISSNAANYVGGNGELRAVASWNPINDESPAFDGWLHCVDFVRWAIR